MIFITGATDGIGLETAQQLARNGHELVLHGRNEVKALRACDLIRRTTPDARLHGIFADLADLGSVARMAAALGATLPRLDVLVNNAGVYMNERRLSKDGFEMTLAVNHIAHFLLAVLLLPLLKRSDDARVIMVSSIAHRRGRIEFDNMNGERHFDSYQAYANSKLANALFAIELARREPWLAANSLHPGVIDTKLLHAGFSAMGSPVTAGARTPVFLAAAPEVNGVSGKYFESCVAVAPAPMAQDQPLAQRLWKWTENAVRPWLPA